MCCAVMEIEISDLLLLSSNKHNKRHLTCQSNVYVRVFLASSKIYVLIYEDNHELHIQHRLYEYVW